MSKLVSAIYASATHGDVLCSDCRRRPLRYKQARLCKACFERGRRREGTRSYPRRNRQRKPTTSTRVHHGVRPASVVRLPRLPDRMIEWDACSPAHREHLQRESMGVQPPPETPVLTGDALRRVRLAWDGLPAIERDVVWMKFQLQKREETIAVLLDALGTQQSVSARAGKACRKLCSHLILPDNIRETIEQILYEVIPVTATRKRARIPELVSWLFGQPARPDVNTVLSDVLNYRTLSDTDRAILTTLREFRHVSGLRTRNRKG